MRRLGTTAAVVRRWLSSLPVIPVLIPVQLLLIHTTGTNMLYWSATFILIAILAALFGFGNIAEGATSIAKVLFFIFLVLFILSTIIGLGRRGSRDQ